MNQVFKALKDPIRRDILEMLKAKPLSAGEIADAFQVSKPTISHHLDILKQADLVELEKKGQFLFYSLNATVFEEILVWLLNFKK